MVSMDDALWLGIDVGTQSVKAVVVDAAGAVHASHAAPLRSIRTPTTHEQDPREWITQTAAAVAGALSELSAGYRARIAGLAICATSGTITTVDTAGAPLTSGLMYDDARAAQHTAEVVSADPDLWRRLGYRIQPTWALPKIVWLDRAGALANARVATQADVVASAVIGTAVSSDWSHTLKSGYDLIDLRWPGAALDTLGLDPRHLPMVVAPGSVIGHSSEHWLALTGLPASTPVFAGMTDGCAAQLGAGTLAVGDWHTVIGTTLVAKTVSDHAVIDDSGAIYSHRGPSEGTWFPGGASNVGAGILTTVLPDEDLAQLTFRVDDRYDARLSDIPLSYPLVGRGERFPVSHADAQGFVAVPEGAVSIESAVETLDAVSLLASLLLGIACVERLCVDTMSSAGVDVTGRVTSSGGATRNPWLTQLRADLLGRTISIPRSAEGSLGMGILAAWGAQQLTSAPSALADVAAQMSPVGDVYSPDADRHAVLDEIYGRFLTELGKKHWISS